MDDQFEYIEELMLASLNGRISENDQSFLDEMIEKDPVVAELWRQHTAIADYLKTSVRKEIAWNRIDRATSGVKTNRKKLVAYLSIAVAAVVLTIGGIYLFDRRNNNPLQQVSAPAQDNLSFVYDDTVVPIVGSRTRTRVADIELKEGQLSFDPKITRPGICRIIVPKKLDTKLVLADGTKVWINAASELSFPLTFNDTFREVALTGEAYFEVVRKEDQPFIVTAGLMKVEVKGTHFNVRAYPGEKIETSLSQGSVSVVAGKQTRLLIPDEMVSFDPVTGLQVAGFDAQKVLGWMSGIYRFNNEQLEDLNKVIDRWFGYSLEYKDARLKAIKFSGFMDKKQPLDSFLQRLCLSANLDYSYDHGHINLFRK